MTLYDIVSIAVGALLLLIAYAALQSKKLIKSVLFLSGLSMLSVVAFVLLKAPDVAITEAVIGSGLVTALFVFTLLSVKKEASK
ncbi:MAG: Na(+)/H(+) antiporter subunit B [Candidatus Izemoplasmatales bacterium]